MDSIIRETLRIHAPIHSSQSRSRHPSCSLVLTRFITWFLLVMRKVIGDIVVPASLAAPSESSSYVIPKVRRETFLAFLAPFLSLTLLSSFLLRDTSSWPAPVWPRWTPGSGLMLLRSVPPPPSPIFSPKRSPRVLTFVPFVLSQWEPSRWTDPAGFAATAAHQYDHGGNGEALVDYGFGGGSLFRQ